MAHNTRPLTTFHLFAGAGGGILADLLLGHVPIGACEIEKYPRNVLLQRQRDGILPQFPIWDDIRTLDGKPWKGLVDIVCGGFPCQDISPARQDQRVNGKQKGHKASAAVFGQKCAGLSMKFNLELRLSKTPRICGNADLALCCETLPRWGMMLDGVCLEFADSARIMSENGFSSTLPTPTCHNAKEGNYPSEHTRNTKSLAAQIGGKVNPEWNEWRMGWPIGWTDLKPLETDKFRRWLR